MSHYYFKKKHCFSVFSWISRLLVCDVIEFFDFRESFCYSVFFCQRNLILKVFFWNYFTLKLLQWNYFWCFRNIHQTDMDGYNIEISKFRFEWLFNGIFNKLLKMWNGKGRWKNAEKHIKVILLFLFALKNFVGNWNIIFVLNVVFLQRKLCQLKKIKLGVFIKRIGKLVSNNRRELKWLWRRVKT